MEFSLDKYNFSNCESITLVSSESCNLHCSYCELACSINDEKHKQEAENVKQSFLNGQYLKTIQTVGEKYGLVPEKIRTISLWGQEPTLTMNEFAYAFKDFYQYFPNFDILFFSTNGVAFSERIINLAKTIDETVNKTFYLSFQFSYDGKDATTKLRGIPYEIVIKNIEKTIKLLDKENFKYVRVNVLFHNVISDTIINTYCNETDENLYNFLKEFNDLSDHFKTLNNNPNVQVENFSPGLINPYNGSKIEGQNLATFIKRSNELGKYLEHKWWKGLIWQSLMYLKGDPEAREPLHVLHRLITSGYDEKYVKPLSSGSGCGFGDYDLKIRYSGEIVYCQNIVPLINMEEYEDREGLRFEVAREMNKHIYHPNGLIDEHKPYLEKFIYKAQTIKESSFPFFFTETLNLMFLLIDCDQLDESYKNDYDKIFRHAYYMSHLTTCWDNNVAQTGSGFGRTAGQIRFFCNGYMDLLEEHIDEFIRMAENFGPQRGDTPIYEDNSR